MRVPEVGGKILPAAVGEHADDDAFIELFIDPLRWADIGDSGLAEAVVHSHLSSPPRPSRTDVENIWLWEGKPYLIYSVRNDELAAWTIAGGEIAPLELM